MTTSSLSSKFILGVFFITSVLAFFLLVVEHPAVGRDSLGYAGITIPGMLLTLDLLLWIASAIGFIVTYKPLRS